MANIKQTVDFSQGTLNNLVVVNNKLQLPSVAALPFTRNSIAYKNDGTLVNTNLPRFEPGKFGQAIMVEEGTMNVINQVNLSDLHAWNPTDSSYNYAVQQPDGFWRVNRYHPTSSLSADEVLMEKSYTVSAGQTWTESFYFRTDGTISFQITFYTNLGHHSVTPTIIDLGNGIKRAIATYTVQRGETFTRKLNIKNVNNGTWTYIDIKFGQLEQKPYATSFTDSTRAAETLTISTAGVLKSQEGTIECWVYVPQFWQPGIPNWRRIWGVGREAGAGMYVLRYDPANGKIVFGIYNNEGTAQNISVDKPSVGWHYFVAKWSASEMALLIDGVKVGSITNPNLPSNFADTVISIGCSPDDPYDNVNTLIDDLRISSIARSDEEILAAYQSGQPLPVDEWTTYLLRFSGALNFGIGGYYISPQYDLSTVGSYVKHRVYWQEDADQGECLVYAKLDNQSDWTQLNNGGSLPIVVGQDLTGRNIQFKAKLLDLV